jgi:hypothetical protein
VIEKSNVVEVDFFRNLSSEKNIFIKECREKLRLEGEEILQNVNQLLEQAKTLT